MLGRQSDDSEYKPLRRRWGSSQRFHKPPSWWGGAGCPSPRTTSLTFGPSGLVSPILTPKLVPTPLETIVYILKLFFTPCGASLNILAPKRRYKIQGLTDRLSVCCGASDDDTTTCAYSKSIGKDYSMR